MTRPQLLALAKERGFKRYSALNKCELIKLLKKGSHDPPIPKKWYSIIDSGKGVSFDQLFTSYDHMHKYDVGEQQEGDGYIIRGVNLDGMFNSVYVPEQMTYGIDTRWDTDDEDDDPHYIRIPRKIPGGWLIHRNDYSNYKKFIKSLRDAKSQQQPRTLFELAARVVNSRKLNVYIPPSLKNRISQYK